MTNKKQSMKKPIFHLNGSKIKSINTFGTELRNTFFFDSGLNLKSLDVLDDVLHGGYGVLNCEEEIIVVWQNYKKSEKALSKDLLETILNMFRKNPYIELILD